MLCCVVSEVNVLLLFFQVKRVLYIFAGQRSKEYLNDFLGYHVDTGTIEVVSDGTNKESCQAGTEITAFLLCQCNVENINH